MSTPKISIICPVYNEEVYLKKCINSLIAQTFAEWELIIVNDGSTDNSGIIADQFSANDNRIRVIHKANGGVSAARQTGLDACRGDYIIHVDPDDWVEPEMLMDLYKAANKEGADMVICDFIRNINGRSVYIEQKPSSLDPSVILKELFKNLHGSCCNKLTKRSACLKYNVRFPLGVNYSEDVCFNVQLLLHNIKVEYLPKAYYHYVQWPSSITNNFTLRTLDTCKKYVDFLGKLLPPTSEEVKKAKEMVKTNAVDAHILTNKQIKNLYPEIKGTTTDRFYQKIGYGLAFSGRQECSNIIFKGVDAIIKIRQLLFGR